MNTLLQSPPSLNPLNPIDLHYTWHPAFFQAVQFVEALAATPVTPRTAAIFALLLQDLHAPVRTEVVTWLEHYIENFISSDPSTQTDQVEKLIAVATYLYLCFDNNVSPRYPYLPYLEYAAKLHWLNDSLLAFMCWQLRDDVEICQQAQSYFVNNLHTFIHKRRSRELSQLLLVASDALSPFDRDTILATLQKTMADPTTPLPNLSWIALAVGGQSQSPPPLFVKLIEDLYANLQNTLNTIFRNTKLIEAVTTLWNTPQNMVVRFSNTPEPTHETDIVIPLTNFENAPAMAPIDIALAAYALCKTGNHQALSIPIHAKTDITLAIQHYLAHSKGHIYISKLENALLNTMVIVLTILGGSALLLLNSGGTFDIKGRIDIFNPDLTPLVVAFGLLLLVEIVFTLRNQPITKVLDLIPFLRETLNNFSTKKGNRT